MRILLVNDTRSSHNPGCKAASTAIVDLYGRRFPGASFASLPLGHWAEDFKPIAISPSRVLESPPSGFARTADAAPAIDSRKWMEVAERLCAHDEATGELLTNADLVVINGEGSIHHNFPRALALLALAMAATKLGRPVHLINATIQAMEARLLEIVLPTLQLLHVREPSSLEYVSRWNPNTRMTVDLAVIAPFEEGRPAPERVDPASTILSSGVIGGGAIRSQVAAIRDLGLSATYFSASDGNESQVSQSIARELGMGLVLAEQQDWHGVVNRMGCFGLGVSGRHHMLLFMLLAGVPAVPLPSNTWKIEATLRLIGYTVPIARTVEELKAGLRSVRDKRDSFVEHARQAAARSIASAREFSRFV
jgi:hypothetical protein